MGGEERGAGRKTPLFSPIVILFKKTWNKLSYLMIHAS